MPEATPKRQPPAKSRSLINLSSAKLVSWDIDGTMYSIRRMKFALLASYLREVAGGRGLIAARELTSLRRYRAKIEAARLSVGAFNQKVPRPGRDQTLEIEERWFGLAIQSAGLRGGVMELIKLLAEKGVPQVVLSDYQVEYKLKALRLNQACFAAIYEGESLGIIKPNRRIFEQICLDFDVPKKSILHIGDRLDTDEVAARGAGCECLILNRDFKNFGALVEVLLTKP